MIRLAVAGAAGRMGRSVVELAASDARFQVTAQLDRGDRCDLANCDVLIDFTDAMGTASWLDACCKHRTPMVIGATGHDDATLRRIGGAATVIPIVKAANFSVGVNTLLAIVGKLAADLGPGYDIEIVETHHRNKVDAPSGTAISFADSIQSTLEGTKAHRHEGTEDDGSTVRRSDEATKQSMATKPRRHEDTKDAIATKQRSDEAIEPGCASASANTSNIIHGRSGHSGVRPVGEIAIHAIRMGDVVGQHEIHFSGAGETITIKHAAHSRTMFAAGALRAAEWIIGKPPKCYSMREVLGYIV